MNITQTIKDGYKFFYRSGSPDEEALKHCSLKNDISVDPFYDIKENDIIVMIGAYIGFFSIYSSSKTKKGVVYAIEPEKNNYEILNKNIEINKIKNIETVNVAIGRKNGETKLFIENNSAGHSVTQLGGEYQIVKTLTLDNFYEKYKIKNCDLLKINCEGAEFEIIKYATPRVFEKIKNLIISYHLDKVKNYKIFDLTSILKNNGYFVYTVRRGEFRGWILAYKKITLSQACKLIRYICFRWYQKFYFFYKYKICRTVKTS